jgi:twitching motility protein PilT
LDVVSLTIAYLDQFFALVAGQGASDLHIAEGQPPRIRKHGDVMAIRQEPVTREEAVFMLREISGPENWTLFEKEGDLDFAYEMEGASRFRCNFLKQAAGYGAVFRLIPAHIATVEELGLPPVVKQFGHLRGGLVLITGPTGSGKSTTLAALIDYINANFARHIVTIEEPVEFVHQNKKSVITQREVPVNSATFTDALRVPCARMPMSSSWARCAIWRQLRSR